LIHFPTHVKFENERIKKENCELYKIKCIFIEMVNVNINFNDEEYGALMDKARKRSLEVEIILVFIYFLSIV
jgi:hypothetical protein